MKLTKEKLEKLIQEADAVMVNVELYEKQAYYGETYILSREDEGLITDLEFPVARLLEGEVRDNGTLLVTIDGGIGAQNFELQFLKWTPIDIKTL